MRLTSQAESILIQPESSDDAKQCIYLAKRTPWKFSQHARAWVVPKWAFGGLPDSFQRFQVLGGGSDERRLRENRFVLSLLPPQCKPYPFQQEEILNLMSGAWGMWAAAGVGKTLQALCAYYLLKKQGKVKGMIVVGPENGRHVWCGPDGDGAKWINEPGFYVEPTADGSNPLPDEGIIYTTGAKVFLAPYHTWLQEKLRTGQFILCLDESHMLCGPGSKRFAMLRSWANWCKYRWLLSATPTGNYPDTFWGPYTLLTLSTVTLDTWVQWFRIGDKTGSQSRWHTSRLKALGDYLSFCTSVIKKEDVAPWLPSVTHRLIKVPMVGRQLGLYKELLGLSKASTSLLAQMQAAGKNDWRHQLIYLTSMASHPIVAQDNSWKDSDIAKLPVLRELISGAGDQKICIWSWHPKVLNWLANILGPSAVCYHGEVSKAGKETAVKRFNEDPDCQFFLGNPSAAGTSLNLGAGTVRIFWDMGWSWNQYHQACERINRITRTKPITSYVMLSEHSVEEIMWGSVGRKEELSSLIISKDQSPTTYEEVMKAWQTL